MAPTRTFQPGQRKQTLAAFILFLSCSYASLAGANSLADNSIHDSHQAHQGAARAGANQRLPGRAYSQLASQPQQQPLAANLNRCQSGWMWFNNKCWVTTQSRRDFSHAIELCKKMYNSTLPTIHSEDENEFLKQNIDLSNSPIWLFAKHNHQYNKTKWLDKSPVNYTRWDAGQPSDKSSLICIKTEDSWYMKKAEPVDGQTECVSFWNDARWGTQVGCQVLLPVVCERKLTPISRVYSEGPNNSISSQFEQQQMLPISAAQSSFTAYNSQTTLLLTLMLAATISSLIGTRAR